MKTQNTAIQNGRIEPQVVAKARQFIDEHYNEELSLGQVARFVNTSVFYFCKLFKNSTGINFTDYVSQVRTGRARQLLQDPNLRISEIAFDVGFQSLTHFNRVFKKFVGTSPSQYRARLRDETSIQSVNEGGAAGSVSPAPVPQLKFYSKLGNSKLIEGLQALTSGTGNASQIEHSTQVMLNELQEVKIALDAEIHRITQIQGSNSKHFFAPPAANEWQMTRQVR